MLSGKMDIFIVYFSRLCLFVGCLVVWFTYRVSSTSSSSSQINTRSDLSH